MQDGLTSRATIITGRISAATGGPVATIGNIRDVLEEHFDRVDIVAMPPLDPTALPVPFREHVITTSNILQLLRECHRATSDSQIVVLVGVWHPAFAITALRSVFSPGLRVVLVPTNSLTPWDWAKHRNLKRMLRPIMWLLAGRIDVLMTASTGELNDSWPKKRFRHALVVPHAVRVDTDLHATASAPIRTMIYAARIEPQKDMNLFLETAARLPDTMAIEVFGTGSQTEMMDAKAKALQLGLDVNWHGWTAKRRILEHLAEGAVLLVTSKAENFCHSAAEAASIGAPVVIVDRISSASDLARNPLITSVAADPDHLAAEVIRVSNDISRPVEAGKQYSEGEWSSAAYSRRWNEVFLRLGISSKLQGTNR